LILHCDVLDRIFRLFPFHYFSFYIVIFIIIVPKICIVRVYQYDDVYHSFMVPLLLFDYNFVPSNIRENCS